MPLDEKQKQPGSELPCRNYSTRQKKRLIHLRSCRMSSRISTPKDNYTWPWTLPRKGRATSNSHPKRSESTAANKCFERIEPALLLASRIIQHSPRALYAIFTIRRRIVGSEDKWLDTETELKLPDNKVISSIKSTIPNVD